MIRFNVISVVSCRGAEPWENSTWENQTGEAETGDVRGCIGPTEHEAAVSLP